MINEQNLKKIAKKVLDYSKADETEVLLMVSDNGLTRFANSEIHQNVESEEIYISVRVVLGKQPGHKKIGVASANGFDAVSIRSAVDRAIELANLQRVDPYFISLPQPLKIWENKTQVYPVSEKNRADAVGIIINKSRAKKITASGAYSSSISQLAVANSHGVWAYNIGSAYDLSTILIGSDSSGFASGVGKKSSEINPETIADTALNKVILGRNPKDFKAGEWEVILEPQAVNEIIAFFSMYGPNARIFHEQASYLSGKLNKKVFSEKLNIIDDPLNEKTLPMPFDFEGYPKKKLAIVEKGILKNLVYDSYNSGRFKAKNTGHALPAPNIYGPIPLHLMIKPGKISREQMIKKVKKGLLITRFWYVRVLNPRTLAVTGMTRDGTFLIENGKVTYGVKNLRFNQSIPDALNNIIEIENKLTPLSSFELGMGINLMPYLHIKNWNFTSGTLF